MPDGGVGEDFLHIAGLVQVSVMNGTMRFLRNELMPTIDARYRQLRREGHLSGEQQEDLAALTAELARVLETAAVQGLTWEVRMMPEETHGTIYHPAAPGAFRRMFKPVPD